MAEGYLLGDAINAEFVTGLFATRLLMSESGEWDIYKQEKTYNWHEGKKSTLRLERRVIEGRLHQS